MIYFLLLNMAWSICWQNICGKFPHQTYCIVQMLYDLHLKNNHTFNNAYIPQVCTMKYTKYIIYVKTIYSAHEITVNNMSQHDCCFWLGFYTAVMAQIISTTNKMSGLSWLSTSMSFYCSIFCWYLKVWFLVLSTTMQKYIPQATKRASFGICNERCTNRKSILKTKINQMHLLFS